MEVLCVTWSPDTAEQRYLLGIEPESKDIINSILVNMYDTEADAVNFSWMTTTDTTGMDFSDLNAGERKYGRMGYHHKVRTSTVQY